MPDRHLTCAWKQSLPPAPAGACSQLTHLLVCAVPPQLLPRLLQAQQFKCPHCRTTQGLPEGLGTQQEAQLMSAAPERVSRGPLLHRDGLCLTPEDLVTLCTVVDI